MPVNTKLLSKGLFWAVTVVSVASSTWTFEDHPKPSQVKKWLLGINALVIIGSAFIMLVALVKIRKTLKRNGFGDRISPKRMVVHALAFILYVVVLVFASTLKHIEDAYYFHWFVCMIFADASFICLFLVLWHLGTKIEVVQSTIDDAKTENESSRSNSS